MTRRRLNPTRFAGIIISTLAVSQAAYADDLQPAAPLANNPVSIGIENHALEPGAAEGMPTEQIPESVDASEAPPPIGDNSARKLGKPKSMFSIGPDEPDAQETAGPFARFDPRNNEIARIALSTGIVIGLIFLLRTVIGLTARGKHGVKRPSGVLEVLARYPIARGQHLVLLKLGHRIVLVNQSSSGMSTLSEIVDHDEVAALLAKVEAGSRGKKGKSFQLMLRGYESDHAQRESVRSGHAPRFEAEVIDLTRKSRRSPFLSPFSSGRQAS